jgi:hypothetical protein
MRLASDQLSRISLPPGENVTVIDVQLISINLD